MHQFLAQVFAWLYAIHPTAPYLALPLALWLAALATRKWLPGAWRWLESVGPKNARASRVWLAIPSIMAGAIVAANTAGHDMWDAMIAAACAAGAPLLHHVLKSIPWLPYLGELGGTGKGKPKLPRITISGLVLLCSVTALGCVDHQQVAKHASHTASNSVAEALAWIDARTAADFERRSEQKIAELQQSGGSTQDYAKWLDDSGWTETRERIERAYQAHGLIVSYLDGKTHPTDVRLQHALEDIRTAIRLGIAELESHGVQVPSYVAEAAEHLPKLGALL